MKGWFITGTDTGIGKTHVAAGLVCALKKTGHAVLPAKPVQTGSEDGRSPDLDWVCAVSGIQLTPEEYRLLAPACLRLAASPHLAAKLEGTVLGVEQLTVSLRQAAQETEWLVVEGAGGIRVPLNDQEDMITLMKALGLPVIMVTRPGLGTLNHTRLTLDALREAGLVLAAVVITPWPKAPSIIESDNREQISTLAHPRPCLVLKNMNSSTDSAWAEEGMKLYEALC